MHGEDEIAARLEAIERDLDSGNYRPGPWDAVIRAARAKPDAARAALAENISRVSRKLHMRSPRRTMPVASAIAIELIATAFGAVVLLVALRAGSNSAAVVAMVVWVITLQPLVKVAAGTILGIGYEYGYLYGIEPRFKMKFGNYVAASRWKRIALHSSGMAGSPLGALLVAWMAGSALPIARSVSVAVFWIVMAINLAPMILAIAGMRRLGRMRLADGSGGSTGIEVREALGAPDENRQG